MTDITITDKEKKPEDYFFRASAEDFKKIPGSPIAYWASDKIRTIFEQSQPLKNIAEVKHGLSTGKNEAVVRLWYEVHFEGFGRVIYTRHEALKSGYKWFPYNKGGNFRKWYGNCEYVLRYDKYGNDLMATFSGHRHDGKSHYFKAGVTWTFISSSKFAARYTPDGFIFDVSGSSLFADKPKEIVSFLCTDLCFVILKALNPTLNFQVGNLKSLPILQEQISEHTDDIEKISNGAIQLSLNDWDAYETSWDFTELPLLTCQPSALINQKEKSDSCKLIPESLLNEVYAKLRPQWQKMTLEMQKLEEENNRIFIEAYGLQDELIPEVPIKEITLTCNPYYRYSGDKSEDELEALLLADTMREFISYSVGCMFGRYSLNKEGLILANQGETLEDYLKQVTEPSFMPDNDNVIPLIDFEGDWFEDDISERFKQFLKITFGDEHYQENLRFIEEAIGRDIKKFFVKEFYTDHIKRYKKRPIYWLFSSHSGSGRGTFNALIYMHRYRPDAVSIVLNDYLREFRTKLTARMESQEQITISVSASQKDKTQALKTIEKIKKVLDEINSYEHDILYPLATQKIEIDLDDGVKHNYPLFGKALKKVAGLS
jgi:hypothetical protein